MARNIAVGIDIGTYQIKIVVAEQVQNDGVISPKILGTGFAESRGLRHGYIVNVPEVTRALKTAIAQASKSAGMKIKKAYISVGGIGLSAITTTGSCVISRADLEITDLDVAKTLEITEEEIPQTLSQNKRIIYSVASLVYNDDIF